MSAYRQGELAKASQIIDRLSRRKLSNRLSRKIHKVLLLMLLGELYGLNTFNKLLISYGVKSNSYQKLWKEVSCKDLVRLMNDWLWSVFSEDFLKRIGQSDATRSRQKLTMMLDGSIFKQWLAVEEFGKYFAKYFSGQYKKAVYGFNVLLCGMVIGEVFYPLHFQLRRKVEKDVEIAHRMLQKVHQKLDSLAQHNGLKLPFLYLSVDSGFRSKPLINWCEKIGIIYIGVPKGNHVLYWKEDKTNFTELKKKFAEKEVQYKTAYEAENEGKNAKKMPSFTWRIRVHYHNIDRAVTLLLFRLNGSNKVSIIFCADLDIKAKTLRRHWFERTKIEILFRMIKHDLKIQQVTTQNRLGFMKKLAFALVRALYAQKFTQIVKKTHPDLAKFGFAGIRQLLIFNQIGREHLDELMFP